MDSSKTHERIINLGKQLVQALERDHSSKPVTHWMAHYIAEMMVKAETAEEEDKESAQQKCFEAILMLWRHRAALPKGTRPFEAFDQIFETLERLNPESPRFWAMHFRGSTDDYDTDTKKILHIMTAMDRSVRVVMNALLEVAVMTCDSEETRAYLRNIGETAEGRDVELVVRLFHGNHGTTNEEIDEAKRKTLQERIEHLDRFLDCAEKVRSLLNSQHVVVSITHDEPSD